jgi:hypothetical protein
MNLYNDFLWQLKSRQIKARDNFTCQYCGIKNNLRVHHLIYLPGRKLHDYPGSYLITLCERCHLFEHACYDLVGKYHHEKLLSGMLSIDIYYKLKNREKLSDKPYEEYFAEQIPNFKI